MFNSKVIVAAAVVGFLLSFFTGIFSGVGFGFVVLRAIIFAAILALLAVGVSYIFEKFLDMETGDSSQYTPEVNVGSMVDVTVGDDELPEEDSAPGFYVDANLNSQESKQQSNVTPSVQSESVIQNSESSLNSVDSAEKVKNDTMQKSIVEEKTNISSTAKPQPQSSGFVKSDVQSITSSANYSDYTGNESDEDLDNLPDFGSVVKEVTKVDNSSFRDDSPMKEMGAQDAEAMAQAIVKLRSEGKVFTGRGVSTDIIGASIRSYVNALNKIVYERGSK